MTHEVYAIRYATRAARRAEHFIGGDPHDAPMPMDYFLWAIVRVRGGEKVGHWSGGVMLSRVA